MAPNTGSRKILSEASPRATARKLGSRASSPKAERAPQRIAAVPFIPTVDNTSESLAALQKANEYYRETVWPSPLNATRHTLHLGDARDLSWIKDRSVDLVVTSPPTGH